MKTLLLLIALFTVGCTSAEAQDWAKARLDKSPRHLEWITVKRGDREIKSFIAYPEVKKKATAVVVIHEIFGLSDWIREVCDELAAAGYIAIAPDLLSGAAGQSTGNYSGEDAIRKAVSELPDKQVVDDVAAVGNFVSKLPAANGKIAITGYCWGGTQVWRAMANSKIAKAGFVFYGTADENLDVERFHAPIYGFYGGKDARVTSTVRATKSLMTNGGKHFDPVIYSDAGHGFMRVGESPDADAANRKARAEAWSAMNKHLKKI